MLGLGGLVGLVGGLGLLVVLGLGGLVGFVGGLGLLVVVVLGGGGFLPSHVELLGQSHIFSLSFHSRPSGQSFTVGRPVVLSAFTSQ